MRTHTLPLALFALSVSAVQLPVSGNLSPGPIFIDSKDFEALGRHPNNTRTVTFNQTSNSTAGEWLWRINITDTAIPNRIVDGTSNSGNYSEGFHVVNTQYQFIWPGASNESLQTYLADRRMNVVMEGFVSRRPSIVTATGLSHPAVRRNARIHCWSRHSKALKIRGAHFVSIKFPKGNL
jgi:hypothetical protein